MAFQKVHRSHQAQRGASIRRAARPGGTWDGRGSVGGPRLARPQEDAPELSPTGEKSLQTTVTMPEKVETVWGTQPFQGFWKGSGRLDKGPNQRSRAGW